MTFRSGYIENGGLKAEKNYNSDVYRERWQVECTETSTQALCAVLKRDTQCSAQPTNAMYTISMQDLYLRHRIQSLYQRTQHRQHNQIQYSERNQCSP